MTPAEIIGKLKDYLHKGITTIATEAGLPRTRLIDIEHNRVKKISFDTANAICMKYPTISRDWLLTGEGDMLVGNPPSDTKKEPSAEDSMKKVVNELLVTISMMQEQMKAAMELLQATNERAEKQHSEFLAVLKMMREMGITFAPMHAHEGYVAEDINLPSEE